MLKKCFSFVKALFPFKKKSRQFYIPDVQNNYSMSNNISVLQIK